MALSPPQEANGTKPTLKMKERMDQYQTKMTVNRKNVEALTGSS